MVLRVEVSDELSVTLSSDWYVDATVEPVSVEPISVFWKCVPAGWNCHAVLRSNAVSLGIQHPDLGLDRLGDANWLAFRNEDHPRRAPAAHVQQCDDAGDP